MTSCPRCGHLHGPLCPRDAAPRPAVATSGYARVVVPLDIASVPPPPPVRAAAPVDAAAPRYTRVACVECRASTTVRRHVVQLANGIAIVTHGVPYSWLVHGADLYCDARCVDARFARAVGRHEPGDT